MCQFLRQKVDSFTVNIKQNKVGVARSIADKMKLRANSINEDKKGTHIILKQSTKRCYNWPYIYLKR